MILEIFNYLALGFFACVIAALPLGLVNLSVIHVTLKQSRAKARQISLGATLVEFLFAASALFFGSVIGSFVNDSLLVKMFVLLVLMGAAIFFFYRKETSKKTFSKSSHLFIKGIVLNAVSIQVLSFWIVAIVFLISENFIENNYLYLPFFILGVVLGKLSTLEFYGYLAIKAKNKIKSLPKYMNRIMSVIFATLSVIQLIRIII